MADTLRLWVVSLISLFVIYTIYKILKNRAKKVMETNTLSETRYVLIRKLLGAAAAITALITLSYIWGVEIGNLWVSITGIAAMVAIGFFAVWSLVGNVLAGILIYFTSPFKIGDDIELLPEAISGRVVSIDTLFTLLRDPEGSYVNIPNSLFFQKFIKVADRKKRNSVNPGKKASQNKKV